MQVILGLYFTSIGVVVLDILVKIYKKIFLVIQILWLYTKLSFVTSFNIYVIFAK